MVEEVRDTLDLSCRELKKLEPASEKGRTVDSLNLDNNELHRLDNLETYSRLEQLSVCNNFLVRMHRVLKLTNLRVLCLNNNDILQIEGLKEMIYLKTLKLSGNKIKSIEHLNHNTHLEHLDLSNNHIAFVADISYLKNLKYLNLDYNRLVDLRQCERYLPCSLQHLGIAHNKVEDLTELSHLAHLTALDSFSIQGNPCVDMAGKDKLGFDYRPYVLNWILSVKTIDGFVVSAMESLKAEWLYSQGAGRAYRAGQHAALCAYLASVCPLTADQLESDEQRKLRIILSKAQQHQMQLKEQSNSPIKSRLQSPRMQSRLSTRNVGKSPDRLSASYHASMNRTNCLSSQNPMSVSCSADITSSGVAGGLPTAMCQSYDSPGVMFAAGEKKSEINGKDTRSSVPELQSAKVVNQPLEAASKMVPVPESLMSPDYHDQYDIQRNIMKASQRLNTSNSSQSSNSSREQEIRLNLVRKGSPKVTRSAMSSPKLRSRAESRKGSLTKLDIKSMNESNALRNVNGSTKPPVAKPSVEAEVVQDKLKSINLATHRRQCRSGSEATARAAITIQRMWRGYRSRNLNRETLRILHAIQAARARQHIQKLTCDMEATKAALDSERKIQQLQMQAINALWKKVSALQTAGEAKSQTNESDGNNETMRQLTETCYNLQTQVVELQSCMQEVVRAVSSLRGPGIAPAPAPVATQTDIIAVVTPQEERCGWLRRPQSLALLAPSAPAYTSTLPPPAAQDAETQRENNVDRPIEQEENTTEQESSLARDTDISVSDQDKHSEQQNEGEPAEKTHMPEERSGDIVADAD